MDKTQSDAKAYTNISETNKKNKEYTHEINTTLIYFIRNRLMYLMHCIVYEVKKNSCIVQTYGIFSMAIIYFYVK
jgi:hypothetical protein